MVTKVTAIMKKATVIEYFGKVTDTAKALGISHAAVSKWGENIPPGRAYQIEVMTKGKLKAAKPEKKQTK